MSSYILYVFELTARGGISVPWKAIRRTGFAGLLIAMANETPTTQTCVSKPPSEDACLERDDDATLCRQLECIHSHNDDNSPFNGSQLDIVKVLGHFIAWRDIFLKKHQKQLVKRSKRVIINL